MTTARPGVTPCCFELLDFLCHLCAHTCGNCLPINQLCHFNSSYTILIFLMSIVWIVRSFFPGTLRRFIRLGSFRTLFLYSCYRLFFFRLRRVLILRAGRFCFSLRFL